MELCYNGLGDFMRLRNVSYAKEKINAHPEYIVTVAREEKKLLNNLFNDSKPLHVEIGAGKGQFIHTMAKRNPDHNHIAIEMYDSVIVRALEKVIDDPLPNLYLVKMDAQQIDECFKESSIDSIYLNFSDPWPKARHEKRRLTYKKFLDKYKRLLKPGGLIEFKTDNRTFFEYSLKSFVEYGVTIHDLSLDVHAEVNPDNIMTEFEEKFKDDGPIYKIIISFKEEQS